MHVYDPNGAIHAYRIERNRKDRNRVILFAIGCVCALVIVACAGTILLGLVGR